ncbi:Prostatic spermine-binding-like protein [Hirschfeldia incana]|nr:Prostatic spermine-binding-like protein [Hirschfeldia incana]
MANRSRVITMSPLLLNHDDDLDLDLDLWEVVNPSDGEFSDDSFSVDSLSDDDVISLDDASFISPPPQILPVTDGVELPADLVLDGAGDAVRDQVDDKDLRWAQRRILLLRRGSTCSFGIATFGDYANRGGCYDDGGDDDRDGEYDDSYDLDEELVPRSVCKKLGRQRMRKLGKRAIAAKVLTSKTSPYSHLKPGCFRGSKHGLGLKFKC